MITMIINAFFGLSLFIGGGHILSTNVKLHHYSDEDYKDIFYLKNKASISKNCTRHSELEDIKKIRRHNPNGGQETVYKVTKNDVLEKVEKNESN
ncbi:MAG: hypothetical protein CMG71_07435 [Candidatus Marinimicrobia bacterium]|mgnify:CR=1 FL=1|nr:hypothetical protein [Candidatus Neomarinimicrobiota bacterium]|tara:strand:- start:5555 stop:5839 length:285 start_codon:yes stop_codon:yes gene_type:complete